MDTRESPYNDSITNGNVTRESGAVSKYVSAPNDTVVTNVSICHKEIAIAYRRYHPSTGSTGLKRYKLPDNIIITDAQLARLPLKLEILRGSAH
jgi:hypothetical protein